MNFKKVIFIVIFAVITSIILQLVYADKDIAQMANYGQIQSVSSTSGYSVNGTTFTSTNSDPQILLNISEQRLSSIIIVLNENITSSLDMQVFYATENEVFTEINSIATTFSQYTNSILVEIPEDTYQKIRIDIGSEEALSFNLQGIFFLYEDLTVWQNITTQVSIYGTIVLFLLLLLLLIFISKFLFDKETIFYKRINFPFVCIGILMFMFFLVALSITKFGDDNIFSAIIYRYDYKTIFTEYLVTRYNTWCSRQIIEFFMVALINFKIIFSLVSAFLSALICYCISKIINYNVVKTNWVICALF